MIASAMNPPPPPLGPRDALFLDFDGTLAEIAASPRKVVVDPRIPALLIGLAQRLDGAVAVVSGRSLEDVERLLRPYAGAMAGIYGLERREANGKTMASAPLPELVQAREIMTEFTATRPGVMLEDKGLALAIHYRDSPEHGPACRVAARAVARGRLTMVPGKMVIEIHPDGMDKGRAIQTFMDEPPFRGRRPVYLGDDRPDEAGFSLVNRSGGISVMVGPAFVTAAQYRMDSVAEVIDWLYGFAFGPTGTEESSGSIE